MVWWIGVLFLVRSWEQAKRNMTTPVENSMNAILLSLFRAAVQVKSEKKEASEADLVAVRPWIGQTGIQAS
jgi:hypothetical protein